MYLDIEIQSVPVPGRIHGSYKVQSMIPLDPSNADRAGSRGRVGTSDDRPPAVARAAPGRMRAMHDAANEHRADAQGQGAGFTWSWRVVLWPDGRQAPVCGMAVARRGKRHSTVSESVRCGRRSRPSYGIASRKISRRVRPAEKGTRSGVLHPVESDAGRSRLAVGVSAILRRSDHHGPFQRHQRRHRASQERA